MSQRDAQERVRWLEREVPKVVGEAVSTTEAPADEEEEAAAPNGSV